MPNSLYTYVATALIFLLLGAAGAWNVQRWRYTSQLAIISEQQAKEAFQSQERIATRINRQSEENQKVTNAYIAEKNRATVAAARNAELGVLLNAALEESSRLDRAYSTNFGVDDPRGTIASECATALRALDEYAGKLATKAKALQEYTTGVCLAPK